MAFPRSFTEALLAHLPYADGGELAAGDDLAALGLDSMGVVRLVTDMEDTFDFQLPDELLNEDTFATVGSLYEAVSVYLRPQPADV